MRGVPNRANSRIKAPGFPLLGGRRWQPQDLFYKTGAQSAGHISNVNPALGKAFTTSAGSTLATVAGDPIGLIRRQAGSFDLSQSVSGNRTTLSVMPRGGIRNLFAGPTEDFSNAYWGKAAATVTGVDQINSTGGGIFRSGITTTAGVSYTIEVEAQYVSGGTTFLLGFDAGPASGRTNFNISAGSVVSNEANVASSSVTAVGDGWFKCRVSAVATGTSCNIVMYNGTNPSVFKIRKAMIRRTDASDVYQRVGLGPWDVSESGQSPIWLPYYGGSAWMDSGVQSFGTASLFADAGQQWTVWGVLRSTNTAGTTTVIAKCGATEANRTFQVRIAATTGNFSPVIRGTPSDSGIAVADGQFHVWLMRWNGTALQTYIDKNAVVSTAVGAAAQEAENIIVGARTAASPATNMTGRNDVAMIDRALSDAEVTRLMADLNNTYRYGL